MHLEAVLFQGRASLCVVCVLYLDKACQGSPSIAPTQSLEAEPGAGIQGTRLTEQGLLEGGRGQAGDWNCLLQAETRLSNQ